MANVSDGLKNIIGDKNRAITLNFVSKLKGHRSLGKPVAKKDFGVRGITSDDTIIECTQIDIDHDMELSATSKLMKDGKCEAVLRVNATWSTSKEKPELKYDFVVGEESSGNQLECAKFGEYKVKVKLEMTNPKAALFRVSVKV